MINTHTDHITPSAATATSIQCMQLKDCRTIPCRNEWRYCRASPERTAFPNTLRRRWWNGTWNPRSCQSSAGTRNDHYRWWTMRSDWSRRPSPRSLTARWRWRTLVVAAGSGAHKPGCCSYRTQRLASAAKWRHKKPAVSLQKQINICLSFRYDIYDYAKCPMTLKHFCASVTWVVGCWHGYLSGTICRLAYGPVDATATDCLLLQ